MTDYNFLMGILKYPATTVEELPHFVIPAYCKTVREFSHFVRDDTSVWLTQCSPVVWHRTTQQPKCTTGARLPAPPLHK